MLLDGHLTQAGQKDLLFRNEGDGLLESWYRRKVGF